MIKDKIKTRDELVSVTTRFKKDGKIIGFTSGAFDIIHAGHVDYLERARNMCDVLIVGVNTDSSIKKYKGDDRPYINETFRLETLAALESVDFVFSFEERRNKANIEILKPDLYIKAGDYSPDSLTSKSVIESIGGQVKIIPVSKAVSTTDIIEKISASHVQTASSWIVKGDTEHQRLRPKKKGPAVFLDRDGTINKDIGYLHDPKKFEILTNVLEGIKKFQDMGYRIVIVTNQPGIGFGYFAEEDFYQVNKVMLSTFAKVGILVDKIYFCPHSKSDQCDCRKPNQALIDRAVESLNLDQERSVFIGDKTSDIETGKRAGMKTILVRTGNKGEDGEYQVKPHYTAEDLLDAAMHVLSLEQV